MSCKHSLDEFTRLEERVAKDVISGTPDLRRHMDHLYKNDFVPVLKANIKTKGPKKEGRNLVRNSDGSLVLITKFTPGSHLIPQLMEILEYDDKTALMISETVNSLRRTSVDITIEEATCLICKWVYWQYRESA